MIRRNKKTEAMSSRRKRITRKMLRSELNNKKIIKTINQFKNKRTQKLMMTYELCGKREEKRERRRKSCFL